MSCLKWALWLVMGLAVSCANRSHYASDRAQIHAQIDRYIEGWRQQSGEAFAKPFSDQSSFVNIFAMKLKGQQAIAERHQQIFDGFLKGTQFVATQIQIRQVADRMAIALVDWKLEGLKCRPKGPCPQTGTFTHTFYKNADGEWLIESTQNTMQASRPQ